MINILIGAITIAFALFFFFILGLFVSHITGDDDMDTEEAISTGIITTLLLILAPLMLYVIGKTVSFIGAGVLRWLA